MIEVRLFATLRRGRDKVVHLPPEGVTCVADALRALSLPPEEVSILLVNGFHSKPESPVGDGDVLALFPPVGGG